MDLVRRLLGGNKPLEVEVQAVPPAFLAIDESTPHRLRIRVADAADLDRARDALRDLHSVGDVVASGGQVLEVASTIDDHRPPRRVVFYHVASRLHGLGIGVAAFEPTDLIRELDEPTLRATAEAARVKGPEPHRLDRLAGEELLDTTVRAIRGAIKGNGPREHYGWEGYGLIEAARAIAFNTPGSERVMLEMANLFATLARKNDVLIGRVASILGIVTERARLSNLLGIPTTVTANLLIPLFDAPSHASWGAFRATAHLPEPLAGDVVQGILAAARRDAHTMSAAMVSLMRASPSAEIRVLAEHGLTAKDGEVRWVALELLAHHSVDDARAVWRAFLSSRSTTDREAGESTLIRYGSATDIPEAAKRLGQIIRSKSTMSYTPPRGSGLITFLSRFDDPAARAALDDVSARWSKLDEELRHWLGEHHPELDPARRSDQPVEAAVGREPPTEWPLPALDRDQDGSFHLWFEEPLAHTTVRERFEDLASAHERVQALGSDREFVILRVSGRKPQSLLATLWAHAHQTRDSED